MRNQGASDFARRPRNRAAIAGVCGLQTRAPKAARPMGKCRGSREYPSIFNASRKSHRVPAFAGMTKKGLIRNSYRLMVNLPKSTPRFHPLPVPLKARDTLPLVMTVAREDAAAPACASPTT